ncbi:MAG: FIG01076348: hypothetical protein [uncultured Chloroflexi bacterium]|uniref:Polysaccharide pyruvyl transferase domain-containing protein n=1 Tax=uncultured Chloroflexota bacterium TaxID=166587 RepID=A0A6J4J0T5_9CHLR|nr:MAG: FIG01076348: hypothetical protein [uncultured Chloroflexota bacterium]
MQVTREQPKTGVLTFHRCINYGSYWQARCLVEGLRGRGLDAVLLEHDSPRVTTAEWQCALQPVLPEYVPYADRLRYGVKLLRFLRAFAALPRSRRFPLDDPGGARGANDAPAMDAYRLVVVGSDEVWNLRHPWFGGCGLFWGEGVRASRLVSYAASFGNHDTVLEPWWADRLRRFDSISVRDENSLGLIRSALGFEPDLVLDPCLQFSERLPQPQGRWRGPREPFAAVYGHSFTPSFAQEVRRWAHGRGLPLVSIGYRNAWADVQWLTAGPHDFAQCIARAEAVATNFFHGCVFALAHTRPFVCEASSYRSIKVQNLMATVGGEAHVMRAESPPEAYDAQLGEPPHPAMANTIRRMRESSNRYLDRAAGVHGAGRGDRAPEAEPAPLAA